jgi:hypothetical protein
LGPKVDVGVGAGDWAFVLSESARYGLGDDKKTFQFDTEIGASWGAPYTHERWFGVAVLAGLEWVSSDGGRIPTRVSPTTTLSARFALPDTSITPWLGTDARVRYTPQVFNDVLSHRKPELGVVISLGVMLRVDEILRR